MKNYSTNGLACTFAVAGVLFLSSVRGQQYYDQVDVTQQAHAYPLQSHAEYAQVVQIDLQSANPEQTNHQPTMASQTHSRSKYQQRFAYDGSTSFHQGARFDMGNVTRLDQRSSSHETR